jgi:hypothetical protein
MHQRSIPLHRAILGFVASGFCRCGKMTHRRQGDVARAVATVLFLDVRRKCTAMQFLRAYILRTTTYRGIAEGLDTIGCVVCMAH